MDKGRWDHTASVCTTIANSQRGKGQRAFTLADFHPYPDLQRARRSGGIAVTKDTIGVLKALVPERRRLELEADAKARRARERTARLAARDGGHDG